MCYVINNGPSNICNLDWEYKQESEVCLQKKKKILKNKDLNVASKLHIYKSIIRPIVTYGCETWAMTVTEQNRLLIFKRTVLRKIYVPTQDNDGAWRIKTNEELEKLIKKKKHRKVYKITKIT